MGRYGNTARGVDFAGDRALAVEARGATRTRVVDSLADARAPVAVALPAYAGFIRRLTAPLSSVEKARRVLPSLLDIELPFPLESCAHAFLQLARTADGGVSALAVAARKEDVSAFIERCRAAGFDPVVIEHEAVALWRAWSASHPLAREQTRLIVYLGVDRTTLAFGNSSGLFSATGLRQGADTLASGGPALQRLALWWRAGRELAGARDEHVAWCGPAAENADARRALRSALFSEAAPRELTARDADTMLPRALAGALASGDAEEGNLRQGALVHPLTEQRAKREARTALLAIAASALLLGATGLAGLRLLDRAREVWQHRLVEEARRIAGTDRLPRGQEALAARRALEQQTAGWAAFARYRAPGADALLARAVAACAANGIYLQSAFVRPGSIVLTGSMPDWDAGERLADALKAGGIRTELDRRDAGADERVPFTLRGDS